MGDSITLGVGSSDTLGFRPSLYDSLAGVEYPFEEEGLAMPSGVYFVEVSGGGMRDVQKVELIK